MKLATRKAVGTGAQRRLQLQSARASAPALRERLPQVATLRFELRFEVPDGRTPSPQQHTLYPAARAFFRFACPCSECDPSCDSEVPDVLDRCVPCKNGEHVTPEAEEKPDGD